ncbi:Cell wall synthesis protein kre9 precursor [Ciborinia camelliae]|nr:Cell wall synthesis protein kre9 precursor [Ciborinia camelliae]
MIATATAGGTVTVYSNRFSISGMTGTFGSTFTITGTAGPDTVNTVADTTAAASSTAEAGSFGIPYQSQTGLTKYAPMGLMPGTTITATNTSPQYPTSSVPIATDYLTSATIQTTLTEAQTASFSSHPNTGAAASMPTDDMAKYLARWKD